LGDGSGFFSDLVSAFSVFAGFVSVVFEDELDFFFASVE
jgi:hypothetical protein